MKEEVTNDTIMPDGRPFYAWKNELHMLRSQYGGNETTRKILNERMRLLNIAEIESEKEPHTGDIVVRFRFVDQINNIHPDQVFDKYEVEKS